MCKKNFKGVSWRFVCPNGFRIRGGFTVFNFSRKNIFSILSITKTRLVNPLSPPSSVHFPKPWRIPQTPRGSQPGSKCLACFQALIRPENPHVDSPHSSACLGAYYPEKIMAPFPIHSGRKIPPTPVRSLRPGQSLVNGTQQLRLQDVFALLVLFRRFKRLVILPADRLLALPAVDVAHHVPARRHVAFDRLGLRDIHHRVEKVGFSVLAAEVLGA